MLNYILKHQTAYFISLILLASLFAGPAISEPANKNISSESHKRIIVIDPGHGGHDHGARGVSGTYEKTIALTLARIIKKNLGNRYKVVQTRTGDIFLNINDRAAKANQLKADLFISIHTDAGFLRSGSGTAVYYFKDLSETDSNDKTGPENLAEDLDQENRARIFWQDIQKKHTTSSRKIAETLSYRLTSRVSDARCRTYEAQAAVLAGADMPAVLIEAGYLTNPVEEKKLTSKNYLSEIAAGICDGIDAWFKEKTF